jgi:signal transduction histidine kinase
MNYPLMARMMAPTAAISLLLLAVGFGAAWHVHRMQCEVSSALEVNVASMRSAEELEILVHEVRTRLYRYLLTGDAQHLEAVDAYRPEVERWLAEAIRWAWTEHEQKLMRRVKAGLTRLFGELEQGNGANRTVTPRQVRRLIEEVLGREILEPTHEYLDFNEKELDHSSGENRVQAGRLIVGLLLLGTSGAAGGLVAGLGLARAVSRSLVQLSVPLRVAAGRLDEVVGPITFRATRDLDELESVLEQITDRIGAVVERLRQSEREALRAEQLAAVGQMAAGMAHELRNPLTSMKLLVQAARSREEAGNRRLGGRDLAVLEEEICRLERVTQTFLHFARPPALEKREVEVQPLIEGTVGLVAARAALSDARVECDLPVEPVRAAVDPHQVRQVLLNLLFNALDASGPGGEVRVGLESTPGRLNLCVRDTGPGLPPELGARIFAPFVSTKETGLGLGLSICKRIVEAHGGAIHAQDGPQGGALFTVSLPLAN